DCRQKANEYNKLYKFRDVSYRYFSPDCGELPEKDERPTSNVSQAKKKKRTYGMDESGEVFWI
ncbi:MAG: hypothetical protein ACLFVT_07175, partial [Syntrophobacteria bacterium]